MKQLQASEWTWFAPSSLGGFPASALVAAVMIVHAAVAVTLSGVRQVWVLWQGRQILPVVAALRAAARFGVQSSLVTWIASVKYCGRHAFLGTSDVQEGLLG